MTEAADVVIVGGGVAGASVVIRLAAEATLPPGTMVTIVDAAGERGGGAAYNTTVHPALLLNDPVLRLDRTDLGFGRWLIEQADHLVSAMAESDDPRVAAWRAAYGSELASGSVTELYVPRRIFGQFIRDRFDDAAKTLAARGVVVSVVADRVTDIGPHGDDWAVTLAGGGNVVAGAVVLATGGPVAAAPIPHPRYFRGAPGLDLAAIESALLGMDRAGLLVLGTAASAVEMIYCIEAHPGLRERIDGVIAVSPSGSFPDGLTSGIEAPYVPGHVLAGGLSTAADLLRALEADVAAAKAAGYTVPDVYPTLHGAFLSVFSGLALDEKKIMVDQHSRQYLSLLRKTSTVYAAGAHRLAGSGLVKTVPGRVEAVDADGSGFVARLDDGRAVAGDVLLDCRGFGDLAEDGLLAAMLTSGTVLANDAGLGLDVDVRFEAADGLSVLGPLLAGTARAGDYIWHLEDIPRIYAYASRIAAGVERRLRRRQILRDHRNARPSGRT